MAITQEVIVLNDFAQERRRTTSTGTKSRYTVTVDAEPILHDLSEIHLGEGPALAIQAAIQKQIRGITAIASPTTLLRRKQAAAALAKGTRSAVKRYSGGRIGTMAPSGSVRKFNDSGRLAAGISAKQNTQEKNWTINVAANRLDPSTFRNRADFMRMLEDLARYVTVLRKPLSDPSVIEAIDVGIDTMLIQKLRMGEDATVAAKQRLAAARKQAVSAVRSLLGI